MSNINSILLAMSLESWVIQAPVRAQSFCPQCISKPKVIRKLVQQHRMCLKKSKIITSGNNSQEHRQQDKQSRWGAGRRGSLQTDRMSQTKKITLGEKRQNNIEKLVKQNNLTVKLKLGPWGE